MFTEQRFVVLSANIGNIADAKSFGNIVQHTNFCLISKSCRTQTNHTHRAAAS